MGVSIPQIAHVSVFHLPEIKVQGKVDYMYMYIKIKNVNKVKLLKYHILCLVLDKFVQRSSPNCPLTQRVRVLEFT